MANIIPLKESSGAQFYPQTHEKAVVDSNGVTLASKLANISAPSYVVAWDGNSTPVVANIPAGVTFTYDGNTYTGTLAASSSTVNKTYLVYDNNGHFDEYITQVSGSTYSWLYLGNTSIDLSDYATKEELNQLDQKMDGLHYSKSFSVSGYGYPTYDTVKMFAGVVYTIKITTSSPAGTGPIYFKLASGSTTLLEKSIASPFAVATYTYTPESDVDAAIQFATGNSATCLVEITSAATVAQRSELIAADMLQSAKNGISQVYTINNTGTNESIDITGLPAGTYKIQLKFAGTSAPSAINVYGTSGNKTGIVSTYADKGNGVWFDFVKTDAINYLWLFKADSYTYELTFALFASGVVKDLYANVPRVQPLPPFKYLFSGTTIYISYPSEGRDLVIGLAPGGGNDLFDFRTWGTLPYDSEIKPSSISSLHSSTSDWFSPFQIGAVANIDGDDPNTYNFTGGSHQYDNGISGSTPTARMENLKIEIDGKVVSSGGGVGRFARFSWTNYVQGYNTRKSDGTGREILREDIVLTFDGAEWKARTTLIPLEDVKFRLFYGYQMTGISSGLTTSWRYVGATNRDVDETESGNDSACGMIADGATHIEMWLETSIDLGKRELCATGLTKSAFKSGNKGYFTIFNDNSIAAKDNRYDVVGRYIMRLNPAS
jgi:hypothetical protein